MTYALPCGEYEYVNTSLETTLTPDDDNEVGHFVDFHLELKDIIEQKARYFLNFPEYRKLTNVFH